VSLQALFGGRRDLEEARGYGDYMAEVRAAALLDANPFAGLSLLMLVAVLGVGWFWADAAVLEEVTTGEGVVIPSSREQVIQSLEGGILSELAVGEGDVVERGEVLLRIDDTRFGASYREGRARRDALRASIARLAAEAEGGAPEFPADLPEALIEVERALYESRRLALEQGLAALTRSLRLAEEELEMTAPLVQEGVVSEVEVLRLRRDVSELRGKIADRRNAFRADARSTRAEKQAELAALDQLMSAREDVVRRAVIRAPMRGTVKNIRFTTVGGVIAPGQEIMEIVPLEDQLLVEARIRPKDVAFLRPGLPAVVKITAYDYSIYGGLDGEVVHISPDTIEGETRGEERFYRIRVRTERPHLEGEDGPLPIIPGMTATVEILTGEKTVLDYVLKPVRKVQERALKER